MGSFRPSGNYPASDLIRHVVKYFMKCSEMYKLGSFCFRFLGKRLEGFHQVIERLHWWGVWVPSSNSSQSTYRNWWSFVCDRVLSLLYLDSTVSVSGCYRVDFPVAIANVNIYPVATCIDLRPGYHRDSTQSHTNDHRLPYDD
ncbi:unnamed protein product [Caenorhabditis auriculariae]|uniref:Uncharacterized protein n=1 Tax=Caenorhabditis auriculariae TaxID=2777116 RepID=A0A8S1HS85_9PELO|nr:unnamed protein product [Caenorhabditis auriculariae]